MSTPDGNVSLERLEDQIAWYNARSEYAQLMYKVLKTCQMTAAALLPFLAGFSVPSHVAGGIGVLIVVLEGLQQLNRYHDHWSSYRSTCEALKHEKYLYLANAGPYANTTDRDVVMAERVESLISQEHAKWVLAQKLSREGEDGAKKRAAATQ